MQLDDIKTVIAKRQKVVYQDTDYTVNAVIMRIHNKETRWYYQLELQDLKQSSVVIADIEKVSLEND